MWLPYLSCVVSGLEMIKALAGRADLISMSLSSRLSYRSTSLIEKVKINNVTTSIMDLGERENLKLGVLFLNLGGPKSLTVK